MTGQDDLRAARSALDRFALVFRRNEQEIPGVRELAQYMAGPDSIPAVPAGLLARYPYFRPGHPLHAEAARCARDNSVYYTWLRSRLVYAPDRDLLAGLTRSASSAIPPQVLEGIPHPDPYILLPAPHLSEEEAGAWREIGVPLGAFVYGRRQDGMPCSFADQRRTDLGITFTNIVRLPGGSTLPSTLRVSLPLRGAPLTIGEMVQSAIGRFRFNGDLPASERANLETWLRRHIGQVACTLLYCCTPDPDMTTVRRRDPAGKKGTRRLRPGEIAQLEGIGYRLGAALVQARAQAGRHAAGDAGDAGPGGRLVPHWRGWHTQTYWTGPGGAVPQLRWILPLVVNKDALGPGQELPVAVRPVRRPPRRQRGPAGEAPGIEPEGLPDDAAGRRRAISPVRRRAARPPLPATSGSPPASSTAR